jgi:hypothetical protein
VIDRESKLAVWGGQRRRHGRTGIIGVQNGGATMSRRMQQQEDARGDAMRAEAEAFGAKFSEYNIIAAYENMGAAKQAIDALQLAGLEAAEVSLLGATAAEAEAHVDKESVHYGDAAVANEWLWRGVLWTGAGVVLGAILGLLLTLIPGWPINALLSTMIFAIVGGTLGGFVGVMMRIDAGDNVDQPYRPVSNRHVLLGVISRDPHRVERAESVLNRGNPLSLHRYDRRGQLQT